MSRAHTIWQPQRLTILLVVLCWAGARQKYQEQSLLREQLTKWWQLDNFPQYVEMESAFLLTPV